MPLPSHRGKQNINQGSTTRTKTRRRLGTETICLGAFALATALNSLAPFFIFQKNLRPERIEELPPAAAATTRPTSSRDSDFPWDQDGICYVVEDICKLAPKFWTKNKRPQWHYFAREGIGDGVRARAKKQPKLTLDWGEPFISTSNQTLSIKEVQQNKCDISKVLNHVVMHGRYIHMVGEYYQRIILPMHHMMEQYMSYSSPSRSNGEKKKEVQFYIHYRSLDYPGDKQPKVLDSQRLYTLGLPFGDNLQTWADENKKPSCQCYPRLVFCGYNVENDTSSSLASERRELTLLPNTNVRDNVNKYCNAGFGQSKLALETENCNVWQDLRMSLIKTYERNNPTLDEDVSLYRKCLIKNALRAFSPSLVLGDIIHRDWKIIGLSQRSDRRIWLNINDTLSHCNTRYHTHKIVCVEVNVANLPTNFTGTGTNNKYLSSVEEQMVLYRSIDSLIGIHGSQVGDLISSIYYFIHQNITCLP